MRLHDEVLARTEVEKPGTLRRETWKQIKPRCVLLSSVTLDWRWVWGRAEDTRVYLPQLRWEAVPRCRRPVLGGPKLLGPT